MGMANDISVVELLRRCVIGLVRIGEGARFKVVNLDVDGKVRVGCEIFARPWIGDDSRDHVGLGRDISHDCKDRLDL
jgi:hypothetical protein